MTNIPIRFLPESKFESERLDPRLPSDDRNSPTIILSGNTTSSLRQVTQATQAGQLSAILYERGFGFLSVSHNKVVFSVKYSVYTLYHGKAIQRVC